MFIIGLIVGGLGIGLRFWNFEGARKVGQKKELKRRKEKVLLDLDKLRGMLGMKKGKKKVLK